VEGARRFWRRRPSVPHTGPPCYSEGASEGVGAIVSGREQVDSIELQPEPNHIGRRPMAWWGGVYRFGIYDVDAILQRWRRLVWVRAGQVEALPLFEWCRGDVQGFANGSEGSGQETSARAAQGELAWG
jgi:hypothetical protein